MKTRIIFLLVMFFATPSIADMFSPSHSCSKPYKPYEFNDQYQIDNFKYEVETYKQCINDFIDEMNDASKKHQDAAEEAIDEWNSFVNYELN
jgi:hypothetical protein